MATYYGGETLFDVVHTAATTATLGENIFSTIYTVPTGYYALIKFAYIERSDASPNGEDGTKEAQIVLMGDDCGATSPTGSVGYIPLTIDDTASIGVSGSTGYRAHKIWYSQNYTGGKLFTGAAGDVSKVYTPFNTYASQGDIIRIATSSTIAGNSTAFRYVLDYHLFKSP
jgi:hypothetical protein